MYYAKNFVIKNLEIVNLKIRNLKLNDLLIFMMNFMEYFEQYICTQNRYNLCDGQSETLK